MCQPINAHLYSSATDRSFKALIQSRYSSVIVTRIGEVYRMGDVCDTLARQTNGRVLGRRTDRRPVVCAYCRELTPT